ncbi:MAG: alcohol dehydrogenase catalytic domain-containing protein [Betaproteobacteria bacterium]|nr:alcohol dehydrogenase catalytic domain-containing protein [Betaproteobacteria bacterium]
MSAGIAATAAALRVNAGVRGPAVPRAMKAWVLGGPGELRLVGKPVPRPGPAEVLVRIGATAVCGTDLEVIRHGAPALVEGGPPFNKNFTPGHEYMGTVAALGPGVDEFTIGDRVAVEIHAGCGRCERCREGMYTACLNYGQNYTGHDKGHRANGFTTDGGFAEYAVNHVNTLVRVPGEMSDETATLIVTAGTATYGLDVLGGLIAGQSLAVIGPGPIGLMAVGVAKALGAAPIVLTGTRRDRRRLEIGQRFGADEVIDAEEADPVAAVRRITRGAGVHYAMECSGATGAVDQAVHMTSRGGRVCLAAFAHEPVMVDVAYLVSNNIYLFGIRGEGRSATRRAAALLAQTRFPVELLHTHTFTLDRVPEAIRYAGERIEDAIKVVVKMEAGRGPAA